LAFPGLLAVFTVEGGSGAAMLLVLVHDSVGIKGGHSQRDDPPLGLAVVAFLL
jgi:hypothetical protein